ncbi:hypothetical protein SAMN02745866_00713 [Alteromonadaceae bacterium Bs31]|nr:hypothetical protein SAMN02745866_00713 [Alteromonadaceae bacterium Bs31]
MLTGLVTELIIREIGELNPDPGLRKSVDKHSDSLKKVNSVK